MNNKKRVSLLWSTYKNYHHPLSDLYKSGINLNKLSIDIGMSINALSINLFRCKENLNLSVSTCLKLASYLKEDPQEWLDEKLKYEFKMWFQTYRRSYARVPQYAFQSPIWEAKTSKDIEDQITKYGSFNTLCQFQKDEVFGTPDIDARIHPLGLSWSRIVYSRKNPYSADESIRLGLYLGIDVELLFKENIRHQVEDIQK